MPTLLRDHDLDKALDDHADQMSPRPARAELMRSIVAAAVALQPAKLARFIRRPRHQGRTRTAKS